MTDARSMFPSATLKASDLGRNRVTLSIREVKKEKVGDDLKPVLYFHGKEKGLVLNKTNTHTIGELLGTFEIEQWANGRIAIYATETDYQGKRVACIRVCAPVGNTPPPPPVDTPFEAGDDDVPF